MDPLTALEPLAFMKNLKTPVYFFLVWALLAGCGSKPSTPEAQAEAWVHEVATAADERDLSEILAHIDEAYRDDQRRNKRALADVMKVRLLSRRSLAFVHHISSVEADETSAEVVVLVAGASARIKGEGLSALETVRGDVRRFELSLERPDPKSDFKLIKASWRRPGADEWF